MSNLIINVSKSQQKIYKGVKMLVFDMAGTTINEKGIVYKTLYETIKNFNLDIKEEDISKWHGANKYEVLNNYVEKDINTSDELKNKLKSQLHTNFNNNLKEKYFSSSNIDLIDNRIPELFENIRNRDIKIALNTGYNKDIQAAIIKKLKMNEFIDDYISSEEVKFGRPYPYMIHKLMERNNIINPVNVIKFGDTRNDVLEGLNANCLSSIGVLSGADDRTKLSEANYIIKDIMNIDIDHERYDPFLL